MVYGYAHRADAGDHFFPCVAACRGTGLQSVEKTHGVGEMRSQGLREGLFAAVAKLLLSRFIAVNNLPVDRRDEAGRAVFCDEIGDPVGAGLVQRPRPQAEGHVTD